MNPDDGSPCARMGDIMVWHCSLEKVMAGSGYTSFHSKTLHRLNVPSILLRLEIFIFLCHSFAIATRKASSVFILPSGAGHTPSVQQASVILMLVIVKDGDCAQCLVYSFVAPLVVLPLKINQVPETFLWN